MNEEKKVIHFYLRPFPPGGSPPLFAHLLSPDISRSIEDTNADRYSKASNLNTISP